MTGRHRQLVEDVIRNYRLPHPDYVIGDVGTTLYALDASGEWRVDVPTGTRRLAGLARLLRASTWCWCKLADIPPCRVLQEATRQNTHKLSYYLAPGYDQAALAREIGDRLQRRGVQARLVWSVDEAAALGLLDILPARASKYHALVQLQQRLGLADDATVFCGDSGNDLEVLASPVPSVLVANSEPYVQAEARRAAAAHGHEASLYIASGNFTGMNGNYSAGILEGVAHYHPDVAQWMGLGATG
ncbi:MAG: HAD family hydrolase [Halioglobus sp.]